MSSQDKNKPLNIYRASAGSGKTHLLTGFYIKQLFLNELMPDNNSGSMHFSEVLAVTFTNKATAEMKGRIIDELFLLSQAPKKSDYWQDINPNGDLSEEDIRLKSTELLIQILNEYSSFNISTIDSFFQKIVRSFARELNVPGNYEVDLDSQSAIESAVTSFLEKLDPHTDSNLFDWMIKFSDKRSDDGDGWDFRSQLLEMADKVLNSEAYKQHSQQINDFTNDKKQLGQYEKMLREITRNWEKQLKEIGEQGVKIIRDYDLGKEEFFNGGSGTITHFYAWAEGKETDPASSTRFMQIINDPDKLFKKKSPRCGSELQQSIVDLMNAGLSLQSGDTYTNYVTASFIQQDLYELGIIANIDEELKERCNERNIMLLSSTNDLLSKLIEPYDAPFVYEKTGTRLKSYMIDEFQDTSSMQWHNFMPLVSNALSQGYQNLIVGDVKQSIYRWRGSDWGLLDSEIYDYEAPLHNDNDDELRTNWRSLPAIVEFNNLFFERAAQVLDALTGTEQIKRIYKDVRQELPAHKEKPGKPLGMVHLEYLVPHDEEGEDISKPNNDDFLEEARRQLPLQVIRLQQNGFEPRDIAILCRKKKECRIMAEALLQYKQEHPDCPYPMDIISNEALQLGTRPVIQTLISMMQLLQDPDSELKRAVAWSNLLQLEGHSQEEAIRLYFKHERKDLTLPQLAFRPLYELTELLIEKLPQSICSSEAPFLQAFRDIVLEFSSSHTSDLSAFLEWWQTSGNTKSITTPEAMNAIQIMTIHKSKGLGMPAVIIPFASWEMDIEIIPQRKQIIWCEPKAEPFRCDILLPIRLDKKLVNTIFCEDFAKERLRTMIDNLNTAYVAFTRSKEAMIIMTPKLSKAEGSKLENLLTLFFGDIREQSGIKTKRELEIPYERQEGYHTLGFWQRIKKQADCQEKTVQPHAPKQQADFDQTRLPALSILHSPLQADNTARRKGNCIHRVLQEIQSSSRFEHQIHKLYKKGIIDSNIISEGTMTDEIGQILAIPQVAEWFGPSNVVMNEQTLMNEQGEQIRPDRIIIDQGGSATVIDYKTGDDHRGYRKQVKGYMSTLRDAGFRQVKGFLFFIKERKIVEVR